VGSAGVAPTTAIDRCHSERLRRGDIGRRSEKTGQPEHGPPRGEIEFLFVEPTRVRSGRGQRLARHCSTLARKSADPFFEGFYVAMGARADRRSSVRRGPDRLIPRLRFSLVTDPVTAPSVGRVVLDVLGAHDLTLVAKQLLGVMLF
jgi:hypothetical protein